MLSGKNALAVRTSIVVAALLRVVAPTAEASDDEESRPATFHRIGTVTEPAIAAIAAGVTTFNPTGRFASFDISWVDSERGVYYLADRSNNAVDMIDASDGSFIRFLGQGAFSGVVTGPPTRSGPDGVVTDNAGNVWVGDGYSGPFPGTPQQHSSLKVFNPTTGDMIANIDNGGLGRADELAYGPAHGGRILIANPNEPTSVNPSFVAFVTLVNTASRSIIGKVFYDESAHSGLPAAGHGFSTFFGGIQHGLEQPVFLGDHFYLNVPATVQNPGGEIDVFDDNSAQITAVLPLTTCGGTGLAVLPDRDLLVECGDSVRVIDTNGHEQARFAEFGGADEIWFNSGDGKAYFPLPPNIALRPNGGLGVLDVIHNESLGVTPVTGAQGLHSIAVDAQNNRIFLPISDNPDNGAGGIAMLHQAGRGHESEH
jgi:hypothetical protein